MKKILYPLSLLTAAIAYSQTGNVGINTSTPAATLDIVGQAATASKLDGIIAPRITGDQLNAKTYSTAQNGALIYVTAAASTANQTGQTANVATTGYYYFDSARNQWILMNPLALEPWYNMATNTPATANTQNIYQTGKVSIGQNRTNGMLTITDNTGTANNALFYGSYKNSATGAQPWFGYFENLGGGSWSSMTNANDMAFVFSVDNNASTLTNNGFEFIPHVGGIGAFNAGWKITEQGMTGINASNPSENLDVNGTMRVRNLPASGAANAIYTNSSGNNSLAASISAAPSPTQTFTATRTVVADSNGVLGTVNQLPGIKAITAKSGALSLADDTVLPVGDITLPSADTAKGKIYVISYNGTAASVASAIRVNGTAVSNYSLDGTAGKSGVTLQSDGANWYLISRY